ncbi:MAG TPA: CRTAC1 family protein, partial [Planctomycetaceae bacterium]|nr:CRTAC1 family protein [Planctomycetaceae bacterium]
DCDADGFDDLYITAVGPDALWCNNGDGTFSDGSERLETNVPAWGTSAAFADVNGDGHLDLYVVNYLADSDEHPRLCPNAASPDGYEQCAPALYDGVDDVLFLSDGMGRLTDATAAAGLAGLGGNGLGVVISDLDGDGRVEIFVANDGEANFLLVQDGAVAEGTPSVPRFVDRAIASGVALNEAGFAQANMGIAAGDYDGNGTTDLYITTFFGDAKTLFSNRGGLHFEDVSRSSRLGPTGRDRLGFGTLFLDADNDGWLDLFVANGHVEDRTWMPHGEPYRMRPQLYRNERGGTMLDVSAWSGDYFQNEWLGRGVAIGDLDRDGKIDLAVSHQLAPSLVLRNETQTDQAALTLRLVGVASNRNGYGARVECVAGDTTIVREVLSGGSFQSASAPVVHLGLGQHPHAAVQVRWPSGIVETFRDLTGGEWILREGGPGVPIDAGHPNGSP